MQEVSHFELEISEALTLSVCDLFTFGAVFVISLFNITDLLLVLVPEVLFVLERGLLPGFHVLDVVGRHLVDEAEQLIYPLLQLRCGIQASLGIGIMPLLIDLFGPQERVLDGPYELRFPHYFSSTQTPIPWP